VRKTRVGAFSTTDLDAQLRARKVTTLVLAGISTSGVVLSTVCDGADRDYRLIVLSDGCADPDEEVHCVLLTKVFARRADRVLSGVGDLLLRLAERADRLAVDGDPVGQHARILRGARCGW